MFNPSDTFPYIGLRPFSEDDSLYFKGRDEQILQLTALLEANKFLMVTGASGDGKSSLVYAGLVPNARAGFFNARYTNWVVADFRPERTPLDNLGKTISKNLRIGNEESVEVELRRGFSSLLELYTTSSLYVDETGEAWQSATEEERDEMQRKAANLLIVADQFEEFFTNPENYYKNSPSADSQLVINLLLETARISIAKNLPVYIVCTMRSDYIGQCAAFRGLPEFIGFSQFFVPRLKRKEMVQVVKEPAELHGDKISNRLVERVVYDLGEGIDQLPVLEHAMNEVWIQAKNGSEELDLLHYAMAGGMPPNELPAVDRKKFDTWFNTLPNKLQDAYQRPGLSHIIDTHANKLYLSAADQYNESHDKKISSTDAQLIIKVAFISLTKMDEGRAVRNRMTLQEITDILARPELTTEVVGGVLNIFRESGNTFLRPYITDDPETQALNPESVLDITHESLIRNWELLLTWAKEEYDHLAVYEDFKKQLDRWLASNKSRGFLLPIGPLTFFENWHDTLKPNKYWVNRYLDPGLDKETRLRESQQIIDQTSEFLKRSASKVRVTRMVVKYGATRIAAVAGSILLILLCSYYYRDAKLKENDNIIKTVLEEGSKFVADPRFDKFIRGDFLIMREFLEPGSFKEQMDKVHFNQQFELILGVYHDFTVLGSNPALKSYALSYGDSILRATGLKKNNPAALMETLRALNVLVTASSHYLYFNQHPGTESVLKNSLQQSRDILLLVFDQHFELKSLNIPAINDAIENVLNFNAFSPDDVQILLSRISPYEGNVASENFSRYYPVDKQVQYADRDQFKHYGGYQELAYLYSSLGEVTKVKLCVDSLLKYHPNYSTFLTNILNISTYLFKSGYVKETDELLSYYAQKQKTSKKELYELWLDCSGFIERPIGFKVSNGDNHNTNLELLDFNVVNKLFDQYHSVLLKEYKEPDQLHFNLAIYFKHRAIILTKINSDKKGRYRVNADSLFTKSLEYYDKVSTSYKEMTQAVYLGNNINDQQTKQKRIREEIFLYPDYFPKVRNERNGPTRYFNDAFISFINRTGRFNELYNSENTLKLFDEWLFRYNRFNKPGYFSRMFRNYTPLGEPTLRFVDSVLTNNPNARNVNANLAHLLLMECYIVTDQEDKVVQLYKKLNYDKLKENFRNGPNYQEVFAYRLERLAEYFAMKGMRDDAIKIIQNQNNKVNIIKAYSTASLQLLRGVSGPKEDAYIYLDSALTGFNRLQDFFILSQNPRIAMVLTPAMIGGKDMSELSLRLIREINLAEQSGVIQNLIMGTAIRGDYYEAYSAIPEIAFVDRIFYFDIMLTVEGLKRATDPEWKTYFSAYQDWWIFSAVGYEPEVF